MKLLHWTGDNKALTRELFLSSQLGQRKKATRPTGKATAHAPTETRAWASAAVYPDRLFLKALMIMIVRHLHTVYELLSVLAQPTEEMCKLHELLSNKGAFPPVARGNDA